MPDARDPRKNEPSLGPAGRNGRGHLPVSLSIVMTALGLVSGVVAGLYTARLDVGSKISDLKVEVAQIGKQVDVDTVRFTRDEEVLAAMRAATPSASEVVSEKEHSDLLREVEQDRQNNTAAIAELRNEVIAWHATTETSHQMLTKRLDGVEELLVTIATRQGVKPQNFDWFNRPPRPRWAGARPFEKGWLPTLNWRWPQSLFDFTSTVDGCETTR